MSKASSVTACANTNSGCSNLGTKKCGSCQIVSYCSRECQVADWGSHKALCKRFTIAITQATAAIKEATATSLASSSSAPNTEATEETGPFLFAHTADEEWVARKQYLEDKINNKTDLSEERLARLMQILAAADAEEASLDKLIRLRSFIDTGKQTAAAAAVQEVATLTESEKQKEGIKE